MIKSKFLFTAILIGIGFNLSSQVNRKILIEEFLNSGCGPCETRTPILDEIVARNKDKVVQVRYHTSWPGYDIFYHDNPDQLAEKAQYYRISEVPSLIVDGEFVESEAQLQDIIDTKSLLTSPVSIEIDNSISSDLETMSITVKIKNEGVDEYNLEDDKLRIALTEKINFRNNPGSINLTFFDDVLKTFVAGTVGTEIPNIKPNETFEVTFDEIDAPSNIYDYNNLQFVAFIQNDASKTIVNSYATEVVKFQGYADYGIHDLSIYSEYICGDVGFNPIVSVSNKSTAEYSGFEVDFIYNGEVIQKKSSNEVLSPGSNILIEFDEPSISPIHNTFSFTIQSTNNKDINKINNVTIAKSAIKLGRTSDLTRLNFDRMGNRGDGGPDLIKEIYVDEPRRKLINLANLFEFTETTLVFDYRNWPTNYDNGSFIFDNPFHIPIDGPINGISFDRAYTTYEGSNDGLKIQVSKDCGLNFETIWEKYGAELRTTEELNDPNNPYIPQSKDEFVTENLDLTDYLGEEIVLRFVAISDNGEPLYIDKIKAVEITTSIKEEIILDEFSVHPNPMYDNLNVELSLKKQAPVSLKLYNLSGQIVHSKNYNKLSGNRQFKISISDLESGFYTLEALVGNRSFIKRIVKI